MSCICLNNCQCLRVNAVNIFSKDYLAGIEEGRKGESSRTLVALIELRNRKVLTEVQVESILDLILEKLLDVKDID